MRDTASHPFLQHIADDLQGWALLMAKVTGRASDERILNWIKKRVAGIAAQHIADADGVSQPQVIQSTNKVKAADAAESGENVVGAYW